MKANELMIGDWVYVPHDGRASHNGKVESIYESGTISVELEEAGCLCRAESLEPIPLTEKILEKNGWVRWCEHSTIAKSCGDMFDNDTSISFQIINGDKSVYTQIRHCGAGTYEFRKHLFYVHELQHALRLCGIEKEIAL